MAAIVPDRRSPFEELEFAYYCVAPRLDPGQADDYINRGNARWSEKEYDRALADYSAALRLDPGQAAAYVNRGNAWWSKKEYDRALADYSAALRLDPGYAAAYNNRGLAWIAKGEYDCALADCSAALRLDPGQADAYNHRGVAWIAKGEYERALADYTEALRLDPWQADAYNNCAWLWATCPVAKHRDGKQAVASATYACELSGWKEADHLGTLAAASAEAGDFDAAVKWQSRANELYADAGNKKNGEERLRLYREKRPYRETPP
jgi:tetratricopeptide (TPR) repeat protein